MDSAGAGEGAELSALLLGPALGGALRASPTWAGFAASGLGGRVCSRVGAALLPPARTADAWLARAFASRLQLALAAVAIAYTLARVQGRIEAWLRRVERMGESAGTTPSQQQPMMDRRTTSSSAIPSLCPSALTCPGILSLLAVLSLQPTQQ